MRGAKARWRDSESSEKLRGGRGTEAGGRRGKGSAVGALLGGRNVGGRRTETDGPAGAAGNGQREEAPAASQAGGWGR